MSDLIKNLNLWSESLESDCTVPNELMAEAADLIEQLQQRIAELEATVERLREALTKIDKDLENRNFLEKSSLRDLTRVALESTPQQNLNAVKREVYADGYYDGYRMAWLHDHNSKADHDEYASEQSEIESEKLYPSGKDGDQ